MRSLSLRVMERLRAHGWTGLRRDVSKVLSALQGLGFDAAASVEEVLSLFDGYEFPGRSHVLRCHAVETASRIDAEDIAYLPGLLTVPLCPFAHGGSLLFFAAEDGRFLALDDNWIVAYPFENIDDVLLFALFDEYSNTAARRLRPDECPPGYE
jgi:hypothetical protein